MHSIPGNSVNLGNIAGGGGPVEMSPDQRASHLYICGSTRTGKSKMLEHLVQQDIAQWHESKCGLLLIDPHGSLYNSLISWITWNEDTLKGVPIIPIDLSQSDWTIGYNVMRARTQADPAVVIENFVQAMTHVWGVDGTASTPLFARNCKNLLWALYENKKTLVEAELLLDRLNTRFRAEMAAGLSKRSVIQDLVFGNTLTPKDFDAQYSSTANRFHNFTHNDRLRLMFGQDGASLDLGQAIKNGSIILVSLSGQGGQVSEENAALFATLLLSDLWTSAKERGKGVDERQMKPFYVYLDEFQNFITPTIAKNLDQARGFGLHLILANQFPRQILHGGSSGAQVYDSVMANARSKIVFSTKGKEDLESLAFELFMGVMNPDEIKHKLYSTKVLGYREETRTVRTHSESWSNPDALPRPGKGVYRHPSFVHRVLSRLWQLSTSPTSVTRKRVHRRTGFYVSRTQCPLRNNG